MRNIYRRLPALAVLVFGAGLSPLVATPEIWAGDIAQFARDDAAHPVATGGVVFVGSSSIRLWETLARDFPHLSVVNRGFGGSELADSVFYADRIILPYRPRIVVLYAGDNDIDNGKTPARVLADFRALRTVIHRALPRTWIVFLSIKECPARAAKRLLMREANRLVAADCRSHDRCVFVDVAAPLQTHDGGFHTEMFQADGLHLTPAGYAVWTKILSPQLDELIRQP